MSRSPGRPPPDLPPDYAQVDRTHTIRVKKGSTRRPVTPRQSDYDSIEDIRHDIANSHRHHHHQQQQQQQQHMQQLQMDTLASQHHPGIIDTGLNPVFRNPAALQAFNVDRSFLTGAPQDSKAEAYPASLQHATLKGYIPPSSDVGIPSNPATGVDNLNLMLSNLETKSIGDASESWAGLHEVIGSHPYYNTLSSQRSLIQRQQQQQQQHLHHHTRDRSKKKCNPCYCKVFVGVIGILLVAWGITVPLYFIMGPGLNSPWFSSANESVTTASPVDVSMLQQLLTSNGTVMTAVNCSFGIVNRRYSQFLASPFSGEYQALKVKLETMLSIIFQKDKLFDKAFINKFRPGSGSGVTVDFVLVFNEKRTTIKDYVFNVLNNYLIQHWTMLGTFQIELNSLDVRYIQNKCSVNNGGCSHLCFWSVLSTGYECQCPQHHSLMTDQKTCFPTVVERKSTTTHNPCGDDHFMCKSGGNCIPNTWLCDNVSDCLLGEDESRIICKGPNKRKKVGRMDKFIKPVTSDDTNLPTSGTTDSPTTPVFIWHNALEATTKDFAIPSFAPDVAVQSDEDTKDTKSMMQYKFFG